jgi:hypothetical protein
MVNAELLSEVCQRCDDLGFKDFDKGKYLNALYRSNRLVARKYHLFQKLYTGTLNKMTSNFSADILLDIPDMKEPILVSVNDVNLRKKDHQIIDNKDMYCYYMFRQPDGTYLFNYTMGPTLENEIFISSTDISTAMNEGLSERADDTNDWGKSATDDITILYEALPERDYDETEYFIPTNYEEEQIEYAVLHMAKLGIAKFQEQKLDKYMRLYKLYKKNSDFDKEVVETTEPTRIQIFQYP